jgi:hypothetical protein
MIPALRTVRILSVCRKDVRQLPIVDAPKPSNFLSALNPVRLFELHPFMTKRRRQQQQLISGMNSCATVKQTITSTPDIPRKASDLVSGSRKHGRRKATDGVVRLSRTIFTDVRLPVFYLYSWATVPFYISSDIERKN